MISISDGLSTLVIFEESPETYFGDYLPRVTRSATLDGGVVIGHYGFSHGDRTISIRADNVIKATEDSLRRMVETAPMFYVSCREGYFSGAIESLSIKRGKLALSFLVKEKVA